MGILEDMISLNLKDVTADILYNFVCRYKLVTVNNYLRFFLAFVFQTQRNLYILDVFDTIFHQYYTTCTYIPILNYNLLITLNVINMTNLSANDAFC